MCTIEENSMDVNKNTPFTEGSAHKKRNVNSGNKTTNIISPRVRVSPNTVSFLRYKLQNKNTATRKLNRKSRCAMSNHKNCVYTISGRCTQSYR